MKILFVCYALILSNFLMAEVPVLQNPQSPAISRKIGMEEVWRLGNNEGEEFIFGVIGKVRSDEAGNFYLLDTQLNEVFKFSPDGEYLKSISQRGEGPGEINLCHFCDFWTENSMACLNIFPKGVIRFDLEGTPLSNLVSTPLPDLGSKESISLFGFSRRDGFSVGYGQHLFFENGESKQVFFVSAFDKEMNETYRFTQQPTGYNFQQSVTVDEEADYLSLSRWALGSGGEVYLVPDRTDFLIEVRDTKGNLLREIHRDWRLTKRTKKEKEEAKNLYIFSTSGGKVPDISYKISDYPQTIQHLEWIDGQLWVITSETVKKSSETGSFVVDVFDKAGHLRQERSYHLPFDKDKDQIHWLSNDRAVVVRNIKSAMLAAQESDMTVVVGEGKEELVDDDDSVLEVILYRVINW